MNKYLLAAACLALASCSATKPLPQYSEAEKEAQRQAIGYWQPDPEPAIAPGLHRPPVWSPADSVLWAHHRKAHQLDSSSKSLSNLTSSVDKPGLLRRLFPAKPKAVPDINVGNIPRKCKGCTFNLVAGNQTVAGKKAQVAAGDGATTSVIEKKAGPAVVASDSVQQNALHGPGNIQATNGNNNTPTLTAPIQEAADWRAVLAKPAGAVGAGVLTVVLVGGVIFLIAAYRRRKKLIA